MKMDSEEIDEIIAHLMVLISLTKSALPAVLPEENTASSNGENQNNKRAKIQKNKRLNQQGTQEITEE
jgi:hypothetical protein